MGEGRHRRHVVMIGLMAAGKSTVGRAVARRLGRPFVDNDDQLAKRAGASAREVLAEEGADELHALETELLLDALARKTPSVITAAAAAVLDDAVGRRLDSDALVVWLRADPAVLAARARTGSSRPWLDDADRAETQLERMAVERSARYADVADLAVDVGDADPRVVAEQVAAWAASRIGDASDQRGPT